MFRLANNAPPPFQTPRVRIRGIAVDERVEHGMLVRPTGTPDYLITIFRNAVPVWVGNQRLYIPSPCAMIWPPGEPQQFGMASPWSYSWLHAGGQFLHELMRQYGVPMLTPLPLPESAMVEGLLGMMQHELQVQIPHEHILTNAMEIFILSLMRENRTASDGTSRIPAVFTELKRYLDRHFAAPVTLASLADRSAMSTSAMRYGFKRYFGRPPIEYLIQVRMSHACELLQNHTLRISEVAAQVGYDDPNTFAIIFRRHFGISPRSYRASLRGDVFREQFLHETYTWELAKLLEEGWLPVTDSDFTSAPLLDTHWRCEQYLYDQAPFEITPCDPHFTTKGLEFPQQNRWTQLRWVTPCAEETKLECDIRNTSPDGLNLAFSLSGDLRTGYRLRLYGWHQADLETIAYGRGEVLHHGQMQLDPDASRYRVTLWRSGSTITAEINGQHILTYHDALPLHGPEHRTFAVGRGKGAGGACIHRLRVFMRREARYVDVLEPGRVLLRYGNHEESSAWFQQVATTYQEPSIVQEAEYLSALAMLAGNRADSDMALAAICADPSHLYRRQALREQALQYAKSGEIARAVAALREIATYPPTDDTIQQVLDRLFAHCRNSSDAPALATILPELASLPLTSLNLSKLGLTNLAMITGLSLTSLECSSNYLTSIASVRAMPLQQLYCGENCLTHLHPLQGMALHSLRCHDNQLTDLAPLAGMPLTSLSCWANAISDLTPLQGIPLRELACGHNTITDLSALREMPLEALSCDHNRITDLSPLHGSPTLRDVSCASNHLTSLEPLQGCALSSLTCGDNPIRDLSPLAGMPLEVLICHACGITDISPLRQSPLRRLHCHNNAITSLAPLAELPLEDLACAHNPIHDLAPLSTLPLRCLTIHGIPLTGLNQEVIATLPLNELDGDLSKIMVALLEQMPALPVFNKHARAHALRIGPVLLEALAAWQAGRADASKRALRRFAVASGERAYLALPIQLSRFAALAFSDFLGARLVCPSTPELQRAVEQYLEPLVVSEGVKTPYHLGLSRDGTAEVLRWQSGAPYDWRNWRYRLDERMVQSGECPVYEYNAIRHGSIWYGTSTPVSVLLEWDNGAVYQP